MFCIMCELLFFNESLRASVQPALNGKSATTFCKKIFSVPQKKEQVFTFWGTFCSIKKNSSTLNFVSVAITCELMTCPIIHLDGCSNF